MLSRRTSAASITIAAVDWRAPWSSFQEPNRIHQLIHEDLKAGRGIVSIWSDRVDAGGMSEQIRAWVAASGADFADRLSAFQVREDGDTLETVYPRVGEIVDFDALIKQCRPDVARVHSPAADLFPLVAALKRDGGATVVYDRGDYWPGFPESWSNLNDSNNESRYVELADKLVAVSAYLAREWSGKPVRIIPNAVPPHFAEAVEHARALHPDIRPGDVVYTGGMPPFRFDWKLCYEITAERRDKSFKFIGKDPRKTRTVLLGGRYTEDIRWAELTFALPHVRFIPKIPHRELAGVLVQAESAIMPLHIRPVTLGLSPYKIFEYIACGVNTVSVPLSDYMDYPLVHGARSAQQFSRQLDLAAEADPRLSRAVGKEFARTNTWLARRRAFDELLGL